MDTSEIQYCQCSSAKAVGVFRQDKATTVKFLQDTLLPAINRSNSRSISRLNLESLLLQALDELAQHSGRWLSSLSNVIIDGKLHPIQGIVDSSSPLLQDLFGQLSTEYDYSPLPQQYATPDRLTVLKRHELAHEHIPDPGFFILCSDRFRKVDSNSSSSKGDSGRLSRGLVNMLHANVDAYQQSPDWSWTKDKVIACPIFKSAELQFPYNSAHPHFVSLASSADREDYQLVSLSIPVIDNAHGSTKFLRSKLGLPAEPKLEHVVDHLLKMAAAPDIEAVLQLRSQADFALQGIEQGYRYIINCISLRMQNSSDLELAGVSRRLVQEPWVLVQGSKFVRARELCFDLDKDTSQG